MDLKKFRPLFILAGLYLLYRVKESGLSILGTRTMQAINDFKAKIKPTADAVEGETGISARLGTIQAALESGYGSSDLSRPTATLAIMQNGKPTGVIGAANNIFGFKTGKAWLTAGNIYVMMPTTDYYAKGDKMPNGEIATVDNQALKWPAPFRAYASWDASYRDWARLMQTKTYVDDGALDALKNDDLEALGVALSIHYAPNQNYDSRLASRADAMGLNVA